MNEKNIIRTELAEKLIELRKSRGLNARQAAEAIGVEYQNYRKYETIAYPKEDVYIKIANFYNVSIDYLMGRTIEYKYKPGDEELTIPAYSEPNYGCYLSVHQNSPSLKIKDSDLGELSNLEILLIKKFRKISSEDKNDVANYVNDKKDAE